MKERTVINSRLAIEKGMLPDEAVSVGQLSGGDGIFISQSQGQFITEDGTSLYDKQGSNNMVISQQRFHLNLTFVSDTRLESAVNYWILDKQFGGLIATSLLVVNSVPYNRAWFSVTSGTDRNGLLNMAIITWNGLFPLEASDSIYWSI